MKTEVEIAGVPPIPDSRVLLVKSKWHPTVVEGLTRGCCEYLDLLECKDVEQHTVPGSLELPFVINYLLGSGKSYDAVICLGVILKGETGHGDMIAQQVYDGLSRLSMERGVPIINEVLPVTDIRHAEDRSRDDRFNKGKEAAVAAAEMVTWRRRVG